MTNEEINRRVAEDVMGECWHEQLEGTQWCVCQENYQGHKSHYSNCKNTPYSTSWEAMRLVVERMMKDGWWFELSNGNLYPDGLFVCTFFKGHIIVEKWADTAPMAVCLAALEAVKGEK